MQLAGAIENFIESVRSNPRLQQPTAYAQALQERLQAWEQRYPEQLRQAEEKMQVHLQEQQRLMRLAAAVNDPQERARLAGLAAEQARLKAESPLYDLMMLYEEIHPRGRIAAPRQPEGWLQKLWRRLS